MPWDKLIEILPKIAMSPPAIGAYVILTLALVCVYFRNQKSQDWHRLLDSADKNADGAASLVAAAGFEYSFGGGQLSEKQRLKLRLRQLKATIIICIIVALLLVCLAIVQAFSAVRVKTALLDKMSADAARLQEQLTRAESNREQIIGDIANMEGRLSERGNTVLAEELRGLRDRFSASVDKRYVTQADADRLKIVDATIAFASSKFKDAAALLSDSLLSRVSDQAIAATARAHQLNVLAMVSRMHQRDYAGAIRCADVILRLQPGNWFALQLKANALFLTKRYDDAVAVLGTIDGDQVSGGVNWIFPADVNGTLDPKAIDLSSTTNTTLSATPFQASFHLLGLVNWADPSPCKLTKEEEREQFARHWLSGDLIDTGRAADADILLKKAFEVCPTDVRVLQDYASNLVRIADYQGAERVLKTWIDRESTATNLLLLGILELQLHQPRQALDYLERAQRLAPRDEQTAVLLSSAYSDLKQPADAANGLRTYLRGGWSVTVAKQLESLYAQRNALRELVETGTSILAHNPDDVSSRFNRGLAYFNLRKFKPALDDFRIAADAEPTNSRYLLNVALAGDWVGSFAVVETYTTRLIGIDPGFSNYAAYVYRALARIRLGKAPEALPDIAEVVHRQGETELTEYLYYYAHGGPDGDVEAEGFCERLKNRASLSEGIRTNIPKKCGGTLILKRVKPTKGAKEVR